MKKYINAYAVSQSYGGPEEGGWWFDQYERLAFRVVRRKKQAARWLKRFSSQYQNGPDAGRIIGILGDPFSEPDPIDPCDDTGILYGDNLIVESSDYTFDFYPKKRPRYE